MGSAEDRYLELLKKSLLDELYIENEARLAYLVLSILSQAPVDLITLREIARRQPQLLGKIRETREDGSPGYVWTVTSPEGVAQTIDARNWFEFYHTMIGRRRLDNVHELLDRITHDGIPGDVIETGVWRGGTTIFMRGYLAAHNVTDRTVWVADSFAGVPAPSLPQDRGFNMSAAVDPILAIPRSDVEELFERYDLLDERVRFLEGWFKDTLPAAPIERLALMRLDGDLYESTMDALVHLYHKLSTGGFVIIDDYGILEPCRRAVNEFRETRGIQSAIQIIDRSGVYWRKEE